MLTSCLWSLCCEPINEWDEEKCNRLKFHVVSLFYRISGIMTEVKLWRKNKAKWIFKDQAEKIKMASYGLEAVNEPLEEAVSQLSLDSLRDHKKTHPTLRVFQGWGTFVTRYLPYSQQSLENWWRISFFFQLAEDISYYLQYNDNKKVLL